MIKANMFFVIAFAIVMGMYSSIIPSSGTEVNVLQELVQASSDFGIVVKESVLKDLEQLSPEGRLAIYGIVLVLGTYTGYTIGRDVGSCCKSLVSTIHEDIVGIVSTCKDALATFYKDVVGKPSVEKSVRTK